MKFTVKSIAWKKLPETLAVGQQIHRNIKIMIDFDR